MEATDGLIEGAKALAPTMRALKVNARAKDTILFDFKIEMYEDVVYQSSRCFNARIDE